MQSSPERTFYDRHYRNLVAEVSDLAAARDAMRTRGDRYYCVVDRLRNSSGLTAIEWGFGSASRALALKELFREYTAVDISADAIRDTGVRDVNIVAANLNSDLALNSDHYDVTIAMMVVEHLFDPFHSFREMARITKPGGYVFVNLPLVTSFRNRLRLLFGSLPQTSRSSWWDDREWDGGHLHYFTLKSVVALAQLNGLALDRTYPVGRHATLKRFAPTLLCGELSFVFTKASR